MATRFFQSRTRRNPFIPDIPVRPGARGGPRGGVGQAGRGSDRGLPPPQTTETPPPLPPPPSSGSPTEVIKYIKEELGPEIRRREIEGERTEAQNLIDAELQKLLARQGQDFEQLRGAFARNLNVQASQQEAAARRQFEQSAGRRGLTGSGVEQAGLQAVQAAGATARAQTMGEFETQIAALQQQERAAFQRGAFDFLVNLFNFQQQRDFQREVLAFQAKIAQNEQDANLMGTIFSSGAQLFAGPVGAKIVNAIF